MRKLVVFMALVIAVLILSNAASAFNFADHVKVAQNGKGDTLIFPFFAAANGGWETKLWVINTALDRSVVAKVVLRSASDSQEILDFLIYLTPTDVWTGIIRYNNDTIEYFSDDDSALSGVKNNRAVWANTQPVIQPIDTSESYGYVEVFEAAHSYNGSTFPPEQGTEALSLNTPPVSKNALYRAYDDLSNISKNGTTVNQGLILDGINVLTGVMEVRNSILSQKVSLQATALRDYGATLGAGRGAVALLVGSETGFFNDDPNAFNSIGEVEAALAKNDLAMYYSHKNRSLHVLTFPTKANGPYFSQRAGNGCKMATHYDLTEQAKQGIPVLKETNIFSPYEGDESVDSCNEVNVLSDFLFDEGWVRYVFPSPTAFRVRDASIVGNAVNPIDNTDNTFAGMFNGAPVIGTIVHIGSTNDGYTAVPAAYTDGLVTSYSDPGGTVAGGPINYYYYQYHDERNTGTTSVNNNIIGGVAHDGYDANRPALSDAPIPNENQTRAATPAQQGKDVSQPPVAIDGFHPVQATTQQ